MNPNLSRALTCAALVLAAAVAVAPAPAAAYEVFLKTGPTTLHGVAMWGYARCTDGSFGDGSTIGTCDAVSVPGPTITVPPGDTGLTIHLRNTLPEPTSLVIPGQTATMAPVWVEPAMVKGVPNPNAGMTYAGGSRPAGNLTAVVRSFTAEAAAGAGNADYVWPDLKPGTYLYQSGTHPQVQVQMGLYGAVVQDADAGNIAYRAGGSEVGYAQQAILVYSEIDPALHAAVASGTYGSTGPTSTLEYAPKYFLINGVTYPDARLDPVATVPAAQNTLIRFLNASLKSHVPTINGQYWRMIAEDGRPYPNPSNPRQQYTAFLAPGKTMDVLLVPANAGSGNARYPIYDSRHYDTSNGEPGHGLLAVVEVTPAAAAAPVFDSAPVTAATVGAPYSYAAHATDPNGDTVTYSLGDTPPAGMTIVGSSGLITWTPTAAGSYPVSVRASDGTLSSSQSFNVAVTAAPTNSPPVARNDSYTAVAHPSGSGLNQAVAAPGVLANDSDPEGSPLHTTAATSGPVALAANGGFTLAPTATAGTVSFNYQALDGANLASNTASVTITVVANRAPTAFADAFTVPRCTVRATGKTCRTIGTGPYVPVALNLVSNDSDPDAQTLDAPNQLPLAVARVRAQTSGTSQGSTSTITTSSGGTVTVSGGTVTYVPQYNFSGTDVFQYRVKDKLGLESGTGTGGWVTVTITVQ